MRLGVGLFGISDHFYDFPKTYVILTDGNLRYRVGARQVSSKFTYTTVMWNVDLYDFDADPHPDSHRE